MSACGSEIRGSASLSIIAREIGEIRTDIRNEKSWRENHVILAQLLLALVCLRRRLMVVGKFAVNGEIRWLTSIVEGTRCRCRRLVPKCRQELSWLTRANRLSSQWRRLARDIAFSRLVAFRELLKVVLHRTTRRECPLAAGSRYAQKCAVVSIAASNFLPDAGCYWENSSWRLVCV